jgi:hypothetical protein
VTAEDRATVWKEREERGRQCGGRMEEADNGVSEE